MYKKCIEISDHNFMGNMWLHWCWWRMLATKCVGDNYKMWVTVLAIPVTNIHYLKDITNFKSSKSLSSLHVAGKSIFWKYLCWKVPDEVGKFQLKLGRFIAERSRLFFPTSLRSFQRQISQHRIFQLLVSSL